MGEHEEYIEDGRLISRYLKGETTAFEHLVKKFLPVVYGYIFRMTRDQSVAEDLAQETFIKVWKNLQKFHLDSSFRTWVLAIAHHTVLDWFRKKKHIPFSDFDTRDGRNILQETTPDQDPRPDELFIQNEKVELVQELLERLPPRAKETLILYEEGGMTFAEIGEMLGESVHTVKSRYRRALMTLKGSVTLEDLT